MEAWFSARSLFMLHGDSGDKEFNRLHSWIKRVRQVPAIRRYFLETVDELPLRDFRASVMKAKNALLNVQGNM
jgi:hypothetical protein